MDNTKPGILRNLRVKRVALVDNGANFDTRTGDGAHIMLFKSATRKDGPSVGAVHSDSPEWDLGDQDDYEKATLTGESRRALSDADFAAVWTDAQGKKHRKLPIHDAGHLAAARGRIDSANIPAHVKAEARHKIEAKTPKESRMSKIKDVLKRLTAALTETDVAKRDAELAAIAKATEGIEDVKEVAPPAAVPPELAAMKAHHEAMGKMIDSYGPGPHPPEHPVHAMKDAHDRLGVQLTKAGIDCAPPVDGGQGNEDMDGVAKRMNAEFNKKVDELEKRNNKLVADLAIEKTARLDGEMVLVLKSFKATPFDMTKDVARFRKMKEDDPDMYDRTMAILKASDAQLAESALYKNLGSGRGGSPLSADSAWAQIEAKADELVTKSATALTREQAIDKVMFHPSNKELVKRYRNEQTAN